MHLEGTIAPEVARKLARRNAVPLPANLFDARAAYRWSDFRGFLDAYDAVAATVRRAVDYEEIAEGYLLALARDGCLYAELTVSPLHAQRAGVSWRAHLDAVREGMHRARARCGIESRLIVTALRHERPQLADELLRQVERDGGELVTGFGLAGDERARPASAFASAFARARELGLGCTIHAGETGGPCSVRQALALPITRIGHGVQAVEDPGLVRELAQREIVLEVCPSSNVALGVVRSWEEHPLRRLHDAGVRVTLSSDDPPFFHTTLAGEYARASDQLGFGRAELERLTRTAIEAAFVEQPTRRRLLEQLDRRAAASA